MKAMKQVKKRTAVRVGAILLFFGAIPSIPWEATAANEAATHAARLEYQESSEVLVYRNIPCKTDEALWRKDPVPGKKSAIRGLLQWGGRSEGSMAFVWDKGGSRLYLDLNRNRDLTDDPKGVFVSAATNEYQVFTNVALNVTSAADAHPILVELSFNTREGGTPYVYAGLCSYWQGKASLDGGEWQFGLVENVLEGGSATAPEWLLLRPWAERSRPLNLRTSTPDLFDYSTNLFLGKRAYTLDCRYDSQGPAPAYQANLRERPCTLAELTVSGTFLHRIILKEDKGMMAVLDQPQGTVSLPAGSYSVEEIWLRKGDVEAARFKAGKIDLDPKRTARLTAGGPLTNTVRVTSEGFQLNLNHMLLGADGGAYRLAKLDTKKPPEFVLYEGTNRLAADKFRFG